MLPFQSGAILYRSEFRVEQRCEIDVESDPSALRNLCCSQIHLSGKSQLITPDQQTHHTDQETGLVFRLSQNGSRILLPANQVVRHVGVAFDIDKLKERVNPAPEALAELTRPLTDSYTRVRSITPSSRLRRLCADVFSIPANSETNRLFLEGLSIGIFANIIQSILPANKSRFEPSFRESELIEEISEFIILHLSEKLPIEDICSHFSISKNRLNALFKHHYNQNYYEYVRNQRMISAHQQISETDAPIKAIAAAVGYNHVSNFAIAYRDHFGETPGQTQRQYRN